MGTKQLLYAYIQYTISNTMRLGAEDDFLPNVE